MPRLLSVARASASGALPDVSLWGAQGFGQYASNQVYGRRRLPVWECTSVLGISATTAFVPGGSMEIGEVRFLYAYDRWATRRVLSVLDGLDPVVWSQNQRRRGARPGWHPGPPPGCITTLAPFVPENRRVARARRGATPDDRRAARALGDRVGSRRCLAADRDGRLHRIRSPGSARLADAGARRQSRDAAPSGGGGAAHRGRPIAGRARPDQLRRARSRVGLALFVSVDGSRRMDLRSNGSRGSTRNTYTQCNGVSRREKRLL